MSIVDIGNGVTIGNAVETYQTAECVDPCRNLYDAAIVQFGGEYVGMRFTKRIGYRVTEQSGNIDTVRNQLLGWALSRGIELVKI